jgi:hypothetical protein
MSAFPSSFILITTRSDRGRWRDRTKSGSHDESSCHIETGMLARAYSIRFHVVKPDSRMLDSNAVFHRRTNFRPAPEQVKIYI